MDETYEVIITSNAERNLEAILDYLMLHESWEVAEKVS